MNLKASSEAISSKVILTLSRLFSTAHTHVHCNADTKHYTHYDCATVHLLEDIVFLLPSFKKSSPADSRSVGVVCSRCQCEMMISSELEILISPGLSTVYWYVEANTFHRLGYIRHFLLHCIPSVVLQ